MSIEGMRQIVRAAAGAARYCGAECRRAAKRWRDSKSRRRYRKKESGRRKRREQSRRHRRRQQERKRRGEDVLVAVEAPAWVITQEKRSSSCDRPGCYESFERTRRSPLQRFCTGACRRALYRVIERERRWEVRSLLRRRPHPDRVARRGGRCCRPMTSTTFRRRSRRMKGR